MNADPYHVKPIVRLRELPDIPGFHCVACRRDIKPDRWVGHDERPPVCRTCIHHWSTPFGALRGITWRDRANLARLKALLHCLEWEIINGKRAR